MPKRFLLKISLALAIPVAWAQTFEVASIKPAGTGRGGTVERGGPGSDDPGTYVCTRCNLPMVIAESYSISLLQLQCPKWMDEARYSRIREDSARRDRRTISRYVAEFAQRTIRDAGAP